MPEDPLVWIVITWAAIMAMVSLYYVQSLLGKIEEVKFGE